MLPPRFQVPRKHHRLPVQSAVTHAPRAACSAAASTSSSRTFAVCGCLQTLGVAVAAAAMMMMMMVVVVVVVMVVMMAIEERSITSGNAPETCL